MRIEPEQLQFIKKSVKKFLPNAKVYLFGSRIDDKKRGGDIDILVLGSKTLTLQEKTEIRVEFWKNFGEQKLDIVDFTFDDPSPFKELVLMEAVEIL
ncbi:MAG: nucleotidyltransferase domain-containing protein [Gammaproteobacteria bacterium]